MKTNTFSLKFKSKIIDKKSSAELLNNLYNTENQDLQKHVYLRKPSLTILILK
jgi:hypothetical protein